VSERETAAIVTVGSELVEGLRVDTNTAEIAREVQRRGFRVAEATSVGDDQGELAVLLGRLAETHRLVVVTGGLGPTHDDVTRDAAAQALGREMAMDPALVDFLQPFVARHTEPRSAAQVLTQALVIDGAEVLAPANGTAPGQVLATAAGTLVLLPGPPREMREMLERALARFTPVRAAARELGVAGMPESDAQHAAQRALEGRGGIALTVLAKPGDIRVILLDEGAGEAGLDEAVAAVAAELGEACYATDGSTLADVLVREAGVARATLATAESCTGGLVSAAITDVPGASDVLLGGVVAYSNDAKVHLLAVARELITEFGAVSAEVAQAMARGARERFDADVAVATTGIAGPGGGSQEKPVGLVWFGVATRLHVSSTRRLMTGASRGAIRARSTSIALDLLLREVRGL